MIRTIERITRTAMLAVAFMLCATTSAWAVEVPTPVVVWDGDFSSTSKTVGDITYSINNITASGVSTTTANSCAGDKSYLQVANSNNGVKAPTVTASGGDAPFGSTGGSTVLVFVSNMPTTAGSNRALLSFMDNSGDCYGSTSSGTPSDAWVRFGVARAKAGDYGGDTAGGFIAGGYIETSNINNNAFSDGKQSIALTYKQSNGLKYYVDGKLKGAYNPQSAFTTPSGVCIGGVDYTSSNWFYAQNSMKIHTIAIFNRELSAEEVAAYESQSKWRYCEAIAWRNTTGDFHTSTYAPVSSISAAASVSYTRSYNTTEFPWAANLRTEAKCPIAIFYDQSGKQQSVGGDFSYLYIGGLNVTATPSSGTIYTLTGKNANATRETMLGDKTGNHESWFVFDESYTISRAGAADTTSSLLYGTVNMQIKDGKTFSFNEDAKTSASNIVMTAGSSNTAIPRLNMIGGGQFTVPHLNASTGKLDYSALDPSSQTAKPFINGLLTVSDNTTYAFPSLSGAATFKVANKLSDNATRISTFTIGENEYTAPLTFTASEGTVAFSAVTTLNGDSSWSTIAWDAKPATIGNTTVATLNIAGNTTLDIDSAIAVEKLVLNIADGVTFTLINDDNLTTVEGIVIRGTGTLKIDGAVTCAALVVEDNVTLAYNSPATSLVVSGAITVSAGKTLTLAPSAINSVSCSILNADSIVGTVCTTLPVEEGYTYSSLDTETSHAIVRTPGETFTYNGTIGASPSGWFSDVGEAFSSNLRVGPSSSLSLVYEVREGEHPYNISPSWTDKDISFSLYADISRVSTEGRPILVGIGRTGEVDNRKFLILYREGANVKLGVWDVGKYEDDTDPTHLVGTAATVTAPVTGGYHLYTATFNHTTGDLKLYLDDDVAAAGSAGETITLAQGFQIGSILRGVNHDDWSRCSGDHGLTKGIGMAFAAIRGYDAIFEHDNVKVLSQQFPATSGSVDWHIDFAEENKRLKVCNEEFAGSSDSRYLGITKGTLDLPAGCEVSVSHLRALNSSADNSVSVNINGKMTITSTMDTITGAKDAYSRITNSPYLTYKGVLFGHWAGTGTYNIPTGGELYSPDAYVQVVRVAGNQTINVNGGKITAKALFAENNNATINLSNGGEITVLEIPQYGEAIIRNFGRGTYRVTADATEAFAINFNGDSEANATTLDPCGHAFTMADGSMTGSGYITVASSAEGETKGSVVFGANASFGGKVILTDANRNLMDITAYKGGILYNGTEAATLSKLDGFCGTVYFTSNVDASTIDLSGATVNLAENCTLTALVGKEGKLVLGSGAVVTLKVTTEVVNYEGHVPVVSGSGTVEYYNTDTSEVVGVDYVNGNNLLPYYQIWEDNGGTGNGDVSTASNWKGNAVPVTGKNVAFHVTGHTTINIDADISYNDVQVYGSGSLSFTGERTLSAAILNVDVPVAIDGSAVQVSNEIRNSAGIYFGGTHTCNAVMSGRGAVNVGMGTAADVTFNKPNTFTGGLVINRLATAKTTAVALADGVGTGFGPYGGNITVTTSGQLDIGNTSGVCYNITVTNGGDAATPVIVNTGAAMRGDARQTSSLTVNANATIQCNSGHGWGLVANERGQTSFTLKKGITLTKTGDGTFFMCSATVSNTGTGDAPKFVIAEGALETVSAGTATANILADGASLDITINDGASLEANKSIAASTLTVDGVVNVNAGATLIAASLVVNKAVNVASTGVVSATSVSGAGTVKWTGKQPDSDKWNTCSGWTGTNVVMSAGTMEIAELRPDLWGREGSFVVMKNLKGYLANNNNKVVNAKVILENGDNGYAYNVSNGYRINWYFREISGSGDIIDSHQVNAAGNGGAQQFIFKNANDFTGGIRIDTTTSGKHHTKRFTFSSGSYDSVADTVAYGVIKVLADGAAVIGDGEMWKADYGLSIVGTVTLKGEATIDCPVTATGSSKIVLANAPLTISSTLTATALEIDPGEIELSPSEPTVLITGLTNTEAPDVSGIVVLGCTVSVGGTSGAYTIQATPKSTSWTGESGNWTDSSFNGGDLTTDEQDVSFLPATSDAVTVTLSGARAPANVVFKGGATGYTLTGGTFSPTGTVTVENGDVTIESRATGTYVVKSGATLTLTDATVTSVGGAGTLNIPAEGVVTLSSVTALDSLSYITGSGELRVGANIPGTTLNTLLKKSYTEDAETKYYWHGTVVIEGFTQSDDSSVGGTTLDCGNASSTIKVKNCVVRYFNVFNTAASLEIEGSLETYNGGSTNETGFGPLKGSGAFKSASKNTGVTHLYRFANISTNFTGSIDVKGRRFVFGNEGTANDNTDKSQYPGTVRISANAQVSIGANACWKADNGVVVNGRLIVKGAESSLDYYQASPTQGIKFDNGAVVQYDSLSTLKIGGATLRTPSVAADATVKIAFGENVALVSGTKLISWGGIPEGSFAFDNGAGEPTEDKVVDGVRYVLVPKSDGLYLKARYGTIFSVY